MSFNIVHSLDQDEWHRFVDGNSQGNIFHTPEMFEVFRRARNHRPELWAAVNDHGQVEALLLPVQISLGRMLRYLTTRSVVYGSVLCAPSQPGCDALDMLLRVYRSQVEKHIIFTELRNQADLEIATQSILRQHGFTYQEYLDYLIALNIPVEEVWSHISKSARKHIRHALNQHNLEIEPVENRHLLPVWYATLQKTYKSARVPLADISLFEAAFDVLYPKGMVQFLLGRVQDTVVAASVALLYQDSIYGWYRGFDHHFSSFLPNDLMVWWLLEWGATHGYRVFDFGGAGRPNEAYGPRDFKAKFGGDLVNYGRNICIHSPIRLKLSQFGYQLYRRFLK